MADNPSAFSSDEYDVKIRQTLPYYEEFRRQVTGLVNTVFSRPVAWLDVGCGTGSMAAAAYASAAIERFVFCDSSAAMIGIARERFGRSGAEFCVCDARSLPYTEEFDVVTAIQVFHYLSADDRAAALEKCRAAMRKKGLFITFENFAPFTDTGTAVALERWKRFQLEQGRSAAECEKHIVRYGKDYYPITVEGHLRLMREQGFDTVELLWLSHMQAGFWAMK